jgi:hypothetical protein
VNYSQGIQKTKRISQDEIKIAKKENILSHLPNMAAITKLAQQG